MATVLIIDDSADLRALVRTLLERAGHAVTEAGNGPAGVRRLCAEPPDLVVLDLRMPGMDGFATLARIRSLSEVPVLVLSADAGPQIRAEGLHAGADDVQPKPFGGPELVARVTALLRRCRPPGPAPDVVDDGWARVDSVRHEAVVDGEQLHVTPLELRLLGTFLRHPGIALSHDELIALAWRRREGSRAQVKVAVLALRRKLDASAGGARAAIQTVHGVGYRWAGAGAAPTAA